MRVGVADHLGWAVLVTADDRHRVVDRRRIELIGDGLSAAPIHYDRGASGDDALAHLIDEVRASITATAGAELDALASALPGPVRTFHLRAWPTDLPTDLATLRRAPWESRVDAVRYREVLAELAHERGWEVVTYDAKRIEAEAAARLGDQADGVLLGPKAVLGAPWGKDQRVALAATVVGA